MAHARLPRPPPRILTAVPLCDGHDSTINTINLELVRHGVEVIYLGYHQAASAIARAAVQEDVHAVGISSYNGGHVVFFREVIRQLRLRGAGEVPVFGGGGGTITPRDARALHRAGVDRIFFAGTPLPEIIATITRAYSTAPPLPAPPQNRKLQSLTASGRGQTLQFAQCDRRLARAITAIETGAKSNQPRAARLKRKPERSGRAAMRPCLVAGIAGPGGAGKSTLIDEIIARHLRHAPERRIAVLASDPTRPDTGGALLGDRVSAIYAQDDRVFFRSLATRGNSAGISRATAGAIDVLRQSGAFDLILVESVGLGQDGDPFGALRGARRIVDAVLFVISPHYGGRIQLQKTALLHGADVVVLNKCDDPRATTARAELNERLRVNGKQQPLHSTIAAQHDNPGTDALFATLMQLAGHGPLDGGASTSRQSTHDPS